MSILDPERVRAILDMPDDWRLVGYLCLGRPAEETVTPALETAGWEHRRAQPILRR